ncbi:hypothetical protein [Cucumibacter marinus]|uniref:hypothetical protein n=1 Tax=Cucumibacter marinus TaxID=1121252 RepID=UPI0003F80F40|nr:hypothetical protein [Cucumibacter marinus]
MITRFALFEGQIHDGHEAAFREAVLTQLVPLWANFPGQTDVRVMFGEERDEGAPEFALILAISYRDLAGMEAALNSTYREQSRIVTGEIVGQHFDGRIHHHVTEAHLF